MCCAQIKTMWNQSWALSSESIPRDGDSELSELSDLSQEEEDFGSISLCDESSDEDAPFLPVALDVPVDARLAGVAFINRGGGEFWTPVDWVMRQAWPSLLGVSEARLKWLIRHGTLASRVAALRGSGHFCIDALIDAGICPFGRDCCCGGRSFTSPSGLVSHIFSFAFMRYSAVLFMQPRSVQHRSMSDYFVYQSESAWGVWMQFFEGAFLPFLSHEFCALRRFTAQYLQALTGVVHQDRVWEGAGWTVEEVQGATYVEAGDLAALPITVA